MHKIFSKVMGLTTALTLTVVACGDDITGVDEGDALTSTEVAAVIAALSASFDEVGVAAGAPAAAPGLAPVSFNENIDITVPCEDGTLDLGGSVDGTIDDETFASSRMRHLDPHKMQEQAVHAIGTAECRVDTALAVGCVADHMPTRVVRMPSNLMVSTSEDAALHQSTPRKRLDHPKVAATVPLDVLVVRQRPVHRPRFAEFAVAAWIAHQRQVVLVGIRC